MMPPRTSHHMANPARFCADLLLIVVVATLLSAFPCSAATTILNVMVEGQVPPEEANIALGVQAAAKEFGITISSVSLPANYANLPSAIVSAAKAASAAAVFGMYDDQGASAIMTTTNFGDLVLFGPYTQASTLRQFNENIYFMSADPTAEFQALLKQAIVRYSEGYFALGSVGWMFLTGGVDDDTVMLNALTTQMANLGCNPPIVYHQAADSTFSTATFNTYMSSPPTSMFVFGQRGTHTSAFFTALVTSAEVINAPNFYVVAPFALIQSLSDAYTAITASKLVSTSLWFTSPIPLPSDTRFAAAATFATQIKNIGVTTPVASLPILFSYFGWISGQQLNYILNHYNLDGGTNYAAIKSNVFMQNRYLIGTDIVLGDYGGVCANSVTATRLGGTCNCNSGGRYVAIITLTFGGAQVTVTKETETFIPLDQCFSSSATLAAASAPVALPIHGAVVDITSDTSLTDVSSQVLAAQKASSTYAPSGATTTLAVQSVSATSTTTVNTAISAASRQSPLSVVSGPLPFAAFQTTVGQVVMEPVVAPVDEMPSNASNTLYLSATFPQQIMYIAQHLSSVITSATATTATNRIHLRTRTQTSEELIFFTNRALSNYKLQLSSAYGVGATIASITSTMPTSGYIFVCGMTSADVAPLITFLAANSGATVILSLDTITVFYAALTAAIGTQTAVMKQIWFATNIPLWTQTGSSNSVQKYITTLGASARTPSAVRGLLASLAVYAGTALSTNVTTNGFLASWYQQQFLTVDGATYGPYWRNCVVFPPGVERPCVMNYGAREVSVYAWSSVSDTSTASLAAATTTPITLGTPMNFLAESTTATTTTTSTPSTSTTTTSTTTTTTTLSPCAITTTTSKPIEYTTKPPTTTVAPTSSPSKHTKSTVWKYFVVALEFVVILAACCLIYHILFVADRSASRDPPTDTDAPTSILVIEVDGWKAIHEAVPEQATRCIRKYRARVLNLVARSPCYIARVVDDLYMIVSVNPIDVMNLAKQLQVDMHKMRGEDVEAIESVYNSRGMGPSAIPGLRLRMGIHTEPVDIIFNVATGLYEYYGAGCRIAARTERCAQGGQILLTSAACNSLSEAQLATLNIISLGQRVFPEQSVDLFEMEAVRDRIIGTLSSNAANLSPSDPILTMCDGSTTPAATMVAHEVLTVMHNMLPIGERIKLLRAKCELCGFPPLPSKGFMSKEEYADALIGQLADSAGRAAESSLAPLLSTGQAHKSLSDDRYNSAKAKPTFTKSDSLSSVTQNDTAKSKSDPYDLESQQSDGGN